MKVIILAYILSSLASQAQGKCDGVITIAVFADKDFLDSLDSLSTDFTDVAKVLITNVQQYFLADRFGGKGLLLEAIAVSELPEEVGGSDNATEYLDKFCRAQASFKDSAMWDHAMLLTSKDLRITRTNTDKNLTINGLSNPGSMCGTQEKKCSIIKANRLNTAVVATVHEIGHSLGLQHDQKTECKSNPGIMTESLDFESLTWSSCSINEIKAIFDESKLRCLMKDEIGNNALKDKDFNPISSENQCKLAYGNSFVPYSGVVDGSQVDVCKTLYCKNTTNVIKFQPGSPSLGGTECGEGKKCWNQECVDEKNFDPEVTCREPGHNGTDNNGEPKVITVIKSLVKCVFEMVKNIFSFFPM